MRLVKSVLKTAANSAFRRYASNQIHRLQRDQGLAASSLANALSDSLNERLVAEEKAWICRIESLRRELNSSADEITITDYGAGQPDLARNEEEMYQGVTVKWKVGDVARTASRPYFWSLLLFKLIKEFQPVSCLELGTCLGISGAYQAAALKVNNEGTLITLEGAESLASRARHHFVSLGLDNVSVVVGRFQDTLDEVLDRCGSLDYAFIDGHHDEHATLAYFEKIGPFLSPGAVLVFDDISWSDGMKRAWRSIEKTEKITVSVNMREMGICIFDAAIERKLSLTIPLM